MTDEEFKRSCETIGIQPTARLIGMARATAHRRAHRLGAVSPENVRNRRVPTRWAREGEDAIVFARMWARGDTLKQIAKRLGIKTHTAEATRARLGLPPRGRDKRGITAPREPARRKARVLALLNERGPLTLTQIVSLTGLPYEGSLRPALEMLRRKGEVETVRDKKPFYYKLPHQEVRR